jgi:hypothetical protein
MFDSLWVNNQKKYKMLTNMDSIHEDKTIQWLSFAGLEGFQLDWNERIKYHRCCPPGGSH